MSYGGRDVDAVTQHIVMFSGGIGSWATAKRVAAEHGTANLTLLFADTLIEDEDLYRFLPEAANNVGAPLVRVADGRTPWQLFRDERFLGNHRVALCSRILKQRQSRLWLETHCDPAETVTYVGIDWSEKHRLEPSRRGAAPWRVEAPMCERPWLTKAMMLDWLHSEGIEPPRLYEAGFPHNNCGGFCVRAGKQAFIHLLREMPKRYRWHEEQEQSLREHLGKPVTILSDRHGSGDSQIREGITLRDLRERVESGQQIEMDGFGGCGCFLDNADEDIPGGEGS